MGIVPYSTGSNGLCTTPACINIADDILGSMVQNHEEIDPCTDFDKLVCGNWASRNPIPAGQSFLNTLNSVTLNVLNQVRNILESSYPTDEDAGWITVSLTKDQAAIDKENFAKLQDAYQVCMNSTAHQEEGLGQLQIFVKAVVDKFPAEVNPDRPSSNKTYDHSESMGRTLAFSESFGVETTQRLLQGQYTFDPSKVVLSLHPPEKPGVPSDPDDLPEYLRLVSQVFAAVHPANLTKSESYSLMKSVLAFQSAIAAKESDAVSNTTNEVDEEYVSLSQLQNLAPQLNYKYVVNQLAPKGTSKSKIVTSGSAYWKRISSVVSRTPPQVLQGFFVWKSIAALSEYIDSPETDALNKFEAKQRGEDPGNSAPQWQKCVIFLDSGVRWTVGVEQIGSTGLTWMLSRFFADKNFTPEAKKLTTQIIENLKTAFISRIRTRKWATPEVKQSAIEKVEATMIRIGLPSSPDVIDPEALEGYYSGVKITKSHVINALSLAKSQIARNWASLDKPFDKDQFPSSTLASNAFHSPTLNAMTILAGIQQSPLYDTDYPAYVIYGGMGSIVGHEVTHGFDSSGHKFDKTGNYSSWFDEKSTKGFEDASKCFIKQYSNFNVTDPDGETSNVDGELTLNENVADAGGILASHAAWKKYEAEQGRALDLPGLSKYTHEQLFFIKFGQNWCENLGAQGKNDLTDEHAPNKARILLPLENSVEFQKAFGCPRKKPTCELW
ncbi:endothelin-converting enzyme 1 [Fusarium longipes]|uniref:Endothelin-converting enzyme 1 n=1 Tax=Fusarium longipes TaxID=694270 RepID=A0A395SGM7_9HYPO|nr:endothelin-converting enzyme 1 [Fusarium longipes]